jgi:putative Holliday junction resolvase
MAESAVKTRSAETTRNATFLGFDYGEKKTGVAIGQRITGTASPLETLRSSHPDAMWSAISRLVETWQPAGFVVGVPYPIVETVEKNPMIERILKFCRSLEGRYQRPVHVMDEALSTRESQSLFYDRRPRKSVQFTDVKDELAAQLILQTWLNHTAPRESLDA